jgi:hypothetical protein
MSGQLFPTPTPGFGPFPSLLLWSRQTEMKMPLDKILVSVFPGRNIVKGTQNVVSHREV